MTVSTLLANTSSRELSDWHVFYQLEDEKRTERDLMDRATHGLSARKEAIRS